MQSPVSLHSVPAGSVTYVERLTSLGLCVVYLNDNDQILH